MSGGSFSYLCWKDASNLLAHTDDLRAMAQELHDLGTPAEHARQRTDALLALQAHIDHEIEALEPVWHAIEWWRSNDWGRAQVDEALAEYREKHA